MTTAITVIDESASSQDGSGRKQLYVTASVTNPYSAGGDLFTISTFFKTKFLGGKVVMVNPSVTAANAGIASTGTFRGDTSSITTAVVQFFNAGLSGTASAGLPVDNTVANLTNTTFTAVLTGY